MTDDSTKPKDATTYKETKHGVLPREELMKLEAKGIGRGLAFVHQNSNETVTPDVITRIHEASFGFIFEWAGKFRTIDVMIGDHEAPPFFEVPVLVKRYCDDLEERFRNLPDKKSVDVYFRELVSFLAWLQHRFVAIHPFQDYNGRTARLITNLLLLRLDFPLIEIKIDIQADRERYIRAMKQADDFSFDLLEEILYDALREALEKNL